MARVFNGSSQYLSASSTLLTNEPIDFVCHATSTSSAAAQRTFSLGNNAASGVFTGGFRGDLAGDTIDTLKQNDAGTAANSQSTGYSINTWYVLGHSFISDTSRASFINGGTKATDTTSVSDPTPDFIALAVTLRSTPSGYLSGSEAEAYFLDVNMSDTVHAIVGLGYSPIWSIPISNVRGWYPLQNDNNNRMAGGYPDLAATGSPTDAIHPFNVVYPSINGLITM